MILQIRYEMQAMKNILEREAAVVKTTLSLRVREPDFPHPNSTTDCENLSKSLNTFTQFLHL